MFDYTESSVTTSSKRKRCVDFFSHEFDYTELFVTTSSQANKVYRYQLHEFVDVLLYRIFCNYIYKGKKDV